MSRSVVVHGHFYQPPRENPWTGEIDPEPSAAPFHDWNQRIEAECYAPVASARVLGPDGDVEHRDNLYAAMSFNVGPTLFEWMETNAPATYASILEADRASELKLGHGNAIAMPYHHIILPLASRRDKVTEVKWGIADFRRRFNREPEGMWLPETAVDEETLEVLAEAGMQFTILAPHQVEAVDPSGLPLRFTAGKGREIALCIYDGRLSGDIAFGRLIRDGALLARRLAPAAVSDEIALTSAAMDGETFGHHHRFGEMALARAFRFLGERRDVRIENFASFLARNRPRLDAVLVSPSSWSCPHGVERWRSNCGCRLAPEENTSQAWRAPLREGLEWLAGELHDIFEREGAELHELERTTLRMFSSCAWFFDDLARIETIQVLRYAAFAMELSGDAERLERGLLEHIGKARSNDPAEGTGNDIWRTRVMSARPEPSSPA